MPTVRPSDRDAECWGKRSGSGGRYTLATSPEQLLAAITCHDGDHRSSSPLPRLVQSSLEAQDDGRGVVFAARNGFVHSCIEAYNEHHNLVLRPDDVWLAILGQLSVYVNAHAETLRAGLVTHAEGQEDLHIEVELTPDMDHGALAVQMTKHMAAHLQRPALRDWILPAFSTTTKTDQAVASIVFMGTMQKYFTYSWGTRCGIPAVTLLGEEDDWVELAMRCAEQLASPALFGAPAVTWYALLRPVLLGFVDTFRDPHGPATQRFWQTMVDKHRPNGSGCTSYSGWITAFCYWDEKGVCLHQMASASASDGVRLSLSQVPMGFTKVPVTLLDNGCKIATEMVAGSVGIRVTKSDGGRDHADAQVGRPSARPSGRTHRWDGYDTVQPETGWFMRRI